jgi:hypothetical protein
MRSSVLRPIPEPGEVIFDESWGFPDGMRDRMEVAPAPPLPVCLPAPVDAPVNRSNRMKGLGSIRTLHFKDTRDHPN